MMPITVSPYGLQFLPGHIKRAYRILSAPGRRFLLCRALVDMPTFVMHPHTHAEAGLLLGARSGVYSDSGSWDAFLLSTFDRWLRSLVVYCGSPLSDHSVGERASNKLARELRINSRTNTTNQTTPLLAALRLVGVGLTALGAVTLALSCLAVVL